MRGHLAAARLLAGVASLAGLAACTAPDMYNTAQSWQAQECRRLPPGDERFRCERSQAMSYERYLAEVESAKKPPP